MNYKDIGIFLLVYLVANFFATSVLVPVTPDLGSTYGFLGSLAVSAVFALPAYFALNHFWRKRKCD